MATVLLIIIYAVFIGLGLPDSVFGSAWPAIYPDINAPLSYANYVTVIISFGTVVASFFSAKLINKFGTGLVTTVSTILTAIALVGFSISSKFIWFCLFAIPLGIGAGAIDSALNNYVATHYKPNHMNFLHCFYGVGVSFSPLIMGLALSFNNNWRLGFRLIFYIQVVVCVLAIFALPLWKKTSTSSTDNKENFTPKTLSIKKMFLSPAVRVSWILFFSTVALEFTCGIWGCTFLVEVGGLTESLSASILTLYYLGITLSRFISGLISSFISQKNIVYVGYGFVFIAIILLFLPIPPIIKGISLFLVGFGNGPTFPNLAYLTPVYFGKDHSQSIFSTQMTTCNLGILVMPTIFGFVADFVSVKFFPLFLAVLFVIMVISTILYHKLAKDKKSYIFN